MHQFSRAIFLETRDLVLGNTPQEQAEARRAVLAACERAMDRLANDPGYFAEPARSLFGDIRCHFSISAQHRVQHVVFATVAAAQRYAAQEQARRDAASPRCPAQTRKGTPCQRTPLPGGFCASHQHLAAVIA